MHKAVSILYMPFMTKPLDSLSFFLAGREVSTVCYKPGMIIKVVLNIKFHEVVEMLRGQTHLSGTRGSITGSEHS